jgi:protein TonB
MTAAAVSFRAPLLPWAISTEDEARFRRILQRVLIAAVLLCLAMLFVPPPKVDRTQPQELPPRLAKLVLEREAAPPPKPAPKPERVKEQDAQAPVKKQEIVKVEPSKAAPVPEARRPLPNKPPGEIEGARRKAAGVGLLAMMDQLAELRGAPVAVQL